MTFSLETWQQKSKENLKHFGRWLKICKNQAAPYVAYGALSSMTLWPVVEEALKAGQFLPAVGALYGVAGGVGANLVAEQIQRWADRADPPKITEVEAWLQENTAANSDIQDAVDAILQKLEAIPQARDALSPAEQDWFEQAIQRELAQLGSLKRFEATLEGMGVIIQESTLQAGDNVVVGSVAQKIIAGRDNTYIEKIEKQTVIHQGEAASDQSRQRKARRRYLERLRRRCQALPLAVLGGEDGGDEELTLDRVYIDLDTSSRVPLSDAEKKAQGKRQSVLPGREQEDRPLPALEAAIQHPRLTLLGKPGSGKSTFARKLLGWVASAHLGETEPPNGFPDDLLPILITLRDLTPRLSDLPLEHLSKNSQREALAEAVCDQALADLGRDAADFADELQEALTSGHSLLVLDGLDEVPHHLRQRVRQAVAAMIGLYGAQRIIVTCRIRSYVGKAVLPAFQAHTLAPFDEQKVRDFAAAWYSAQKELGRVEAEEARRKAKDLSDAALSAELRELSENPMLLTTMAIIHQREIGLPKERVRLYDEAVKVLLYRWQKQKTGQTGLTASPELSDLLQDDYRLRPVIERLAYEAHRAGQGSAESADLPRGEALTLLEQPEYLGEAGLAAEFLDYVDQRSGLLVGRGGELKRPTMYSFPHRSFQEYLAGCYMIGLRDVVREFYARAGEGDTWALAAQLGTEELLYNLRRPNEALDLIYRLVPAAEPRNEQARRATLWAGSIAALVSRKTIERDTGSPDGGRAYLERLLPRLVSLLESNLPAIERAIAGQSLAKLGDPRPGVGILPPPGVGILPPPGVGILPPPGVGILPPPGVGILPPPGVGILPPPGVGILPPPGGGRVGEGGDSSLPSTSPGEVAIPHITWRKVPTGPFTMGSDKQKDELAYDDETPQRQPNLPAYAISRYPITNAQYAAFVEDGGYTDKWRACWTEAGWGQKEGDNWTAPRQFGGVFNLPNHPVVGVSWYEAVAFCNWLTEQSKIQNLKSKIVIRLPSEAEWEKAARGTDARIYPWGDDEADPEKANYGDTGIGSPTAVGSFPAGQSFYGCEDMAGNVWEWCSTKWQDGYESYQDDNDLNGTDVRALRGGAFCYFNRSVRCASRIRDNPSNRDLDLGFRIVVSPISRSAL